MLCSHSSTASAAATVTALLQQSLTQPQLPFASTSAAAHSAADAHVCVLMWI